jgi:dolichol kinase
MKWDASQAAGISFTLGLAALLFDLVRLRIGVVNRFFVRFMKGFLRRNEARQVSGFVYYSFGVSLTFFFFPFNFALLAICFLIVGDPVASLVGHFYGKHRLLANKSLEGFLGCCFACCLISLLFILEGLILVESPIAFCLLAGVAGGVGELIVILDDNFSFPIISGFLTSQVVAFFTTL